MGKAATYEEYYAGKEEEEYSGRLRPEEEEDDLGSSSVRLSLSFLFLTQWSNPALATLASLEYLQGETKKIQKAKNLPTLEPISFEVTQFG